MIGQAAREAFELAARLVKEGKFEEALAVPMLKSDMNVIQERIAHANCNDQQSR